MHGQRIFKGLVIACCLMAQAPVSASGLYRWVDENGRTHYGDRPPVKEEAEEIVPKQPPATPPAPPAQDHSVDARQRLLERYKQEREAKKEAARKEREEAEMKKRNCSRAREKLEAYKTHPRLYDELPDGSHHYLSDEEREEELKKARQAVKFWCK